MIFAADEWSSALRHYLILTNRPDIFRLPEFQISFNRYFWFQEFYYKYAPKNGENLRWKRQILELIDRIEIPPDLHHRDYEILAWSVFEAIDDSVVAELVKERKVIDGIANSSKEYAKSFKSFVILDMRPDLLAEYKLTKNQLNFNRYYWLNKYNFEYTKIEGRDPGLTDLLFKKLEYLSIDSPYGTMRVHQIFLEFDPELF